MFIQTKSNQTITINDKAYTVKAYGGKMLDSDAFTKEYGIINPVLDLVSVDDPTDIITIRFDEVDNRAMNIQNLRPLCQIAKSTNP